MISLRAWGSDDLWVLQRTLGDAEVMRHLGGVETSEQIERRHARYLMGSSPGGEGMYVIVFGDDVVGSIGFWERLWDGTLVYETGWMVFSEFAGRGIASEAAREIVRLARAVGKHRFLHAFPSVENAPSNAVCAKAGFANLGEVRFEYPLGHFMQCNDWRVALW